MSEPSWLSNPTPLSGDTKSQDLSPEEELESELRTAAGDNLPSASPTPEFPARQTAPTYPAVSTEPATAPAGISAPGPIPPPPYMPPTPVGYAAPPYQAPQAPLYPQSPYGQNPADYAYAPSASASSNSIAALVLGIVSLALGCGPLTGVPAAIIGFGEVKKIDRGEASPAGRGLALCGAWMGTVVSVLTVLLVAVWILVLALAFSRGLR